jgi:hypothetical protein
MWTVIHWWWFGVCVWWWRLRNDANDRAFLMVRQGHYYDHRLAVRKCITRDGEVYSHGKHIVLVHKQHPFESWEDERLLAETDGELIATPFTGTGVSMDESLISSFMQGDATVQLSNSMEAPAQGGRAIGALKWVLLVVAVIVIAVVVYKFVLHGQIPGITPAVMPTPSPTPAPGPMPIPSPPAVRFSSLIELAGWLRSVAGV